VVVVLVRDRRKLLDVWIFIATTSSTSLVIREAGFRSLTPTGREQSFTCHFIPVQVYPDSESYLCWTSARYQTPIFIEDAIRNHESMVNHRCVK
jgi:hypothetical protein